MIAISSEIRTKRKNITCAQNVEFLSAKFDGK